MLLVAAGPEQSGVMFRPRWQPFQLMLTVAGGLAVITSVLIGADVGVSMYGRWGQMWVALGIRAVVGHGCGGCGPLVQRARHSGAVAGFSFGVISWLLNGSISRPIVWGRAVHRHRR